MKKLHSLALLLAGMILVASSAQAARYLITPSITLQETYDSNVFFSEEDDFEHYISPQLRLDAETERSFLGLRAIMDIFEYSDLDEFDRINQTYGLNAGTQATEKLSLRIAAGFRKDEAIAVQLEEFGRRVDADERYVSTLSPSVTYQLTPRNELGMSYLFQTIDYEDDQNDNDRHNMTVFWDYFLTERTSVVLTGAGTTHEFEKEDGDITHEELSAFAGVRYLLSEILTLNADIGVSRARIDDDASGDTEYVTRYLGNSELVWEQERWNVRGSYQRDITPDLEGDNVTRDRISALVRYQFTERFNGSLAGYYVHSDTNEDEGSRESDLYRISPRLGYRVTERATLEAGYMYSRLDDESDDEDRNRVFLNLVYDFPIQY